MAYNLKNQKVLEEEKVEDLTTIGPDLRVRPLTSFEETSKTVGFSFFRYYIRPTSPSADVRIP